MSKPKTFEDATKETKLNREIKTALRELRASCQCDWNGKRCDDCSEKVFEAILHPKRFLRKHNDERMALAGRKDD